MAAPGDATHIISELHSKLSELDNKLAAYRQELMDEYDRFTAALLQDASQEVSDAVLRAMAESMSKHPSLYPNLSDPLDSLDADEQQQQHHRHDHRRPWDGRKSPPPILHHTSGVPKDAARNHPHPHDRAHAFHGVFSPSYLPLLDGSDRPLHSPPLSPPPPAVSSSQPAGSPFDDEKIAGGAQQQPQPQQQQQSPPPPDAAQRFVRPAPLVRRPTDASSVDSSGSESKLRRSALRRSSSASTRASPRRVRFEVQGEEVLPTASPPQVSEADLPQLASDALPPGAARDESEESTPGRLDDADDRRDWPPARKVSSSERLRALSKLPLEDPSQWTVVNPQANPDESAIMDDDDVAPSSKANSNTASTTSEKPAAAPATNLPVRPAVIIPEPGRPLQDLAKQHGDDDENESSDDEDDFIAMRPSKKSPISPRQSSSSAPAAQEATTTANEPLPAATAPVVSPPSTAAQQPATNQEKASAPGQSATNGSTAPIDHPLPENGNSGAAEYSSETDEEAEADIDDDDEEELFEFDDETGGYPLTRASKLKPKREQHRPKEVEDLDDEALDSISDDRAVKPPGVSISKRVSPPLASPPVSASVGSYRGRSITVFDVVKDPRMHEKAAELGEFNSFIGSIDGRSGFDGADPTSFRASMNNVPYSGTPRSFSERLAMEAAQELRRTAERR